MKYLFYKLILIAFVLLNGIMIQHSVNSQTLFVDDFSYSTGNLTGNGGWQTGGLVSPNKVLIVAPGLLFSGYQGSGFGNSIMCNNPTSGEIVSHSFTTQSTGSVYLACMINVTTLTDSATESYNVAMDLAGGPTGITGKLYVKRVSSSTFNFGISKSTSVAVYSNTLYNTNTTYAAIIKYSFIDGSSSNDSCNLYIFPSNIPVIEPAPTVAAVTGSDRTDLGEVVVSNSYNTSGLKGSVVKIDGIRIGKSWLSALVTGINTVSSEMPESYRLYQNYPNPFNPSTKIKFDMNSAGSVKIAVYDMLGKEVQIIADEYKEAGSYEVNFDAKGLASGTYFYKITAGSFSDLKKMILIK